MQYDRAVRWLVLLASLAACDRLFGIGYYDPADAGDARDCALVERFTETSLDTRLWQFIDEANTPAIATISNGTLSVTLPANQLAENGIETVQTWDLSGRSFEATVSPAPTITAHANTFVSASIDSDNYFAMYADSSCTQVGLFVNGSLTAYKSFQPGPVFARWRLRSVMPKQVLFDAAPLDGAWQELTAIDGPFDLSNVTLSVGANEYELGNPSQGTSLFSDLELCRN